MRIRMYVCMYVCTCIEFLSWKTRISTTIYVRISAMLRKIRIQFEYFACTFPADLCSIARHLLLTIPCAHLIPLSLIPYPLFHNNSTEMSALQARMVRMYASLVPEAQ
jgi:hypothetical protein